MESHKYCCFSCYSNLLRRLFSPFFHLSLSNLYCFALCVFIVSLWFFSCTRCTTIALMWKSRFENSRKRAFFVHIIFGIFFHNYVQWPGGEKIDVCHSHSHTRHGSGSGLPWTQPIPTKVRRLRYTGHRHNAIHRIHSRRSKQIKWIQCIEHIIAYQR